MSKVITTWGNSGTGKTTVAVNLAYQLSQSNALVALISSNLWYGEIQGMLGQVVAENKGLYNLVNDVNIHNIYTQCEDYKNLFLLSVADKSICTTGDYLKWQSIEALIINTKSSFDYIVIDGSSDLNNPVSNVGLEQADVVLNLIYPSAKELLWLEAMREFEKQLDFNTKRYYVINSYDRSFDKNVFYHKLGDEKILGELPFSGACASCQNNGIPVLKAKDNKYNKSFGNLVYNISQI